MLEEIQLPDQCGVEFYSPYFLWNLGTPTSKGETAERTVSDCFQSHFVFRYFCDVLHFAYAPVLIHG